MNLLGLEPGEGKPRGRERFPLYSSITSKTVAAVLIAVGAQCGAALSAAARTPADILVMATRIDDVITLDPAEIFEFSGAEYAANVYDRLVTFDPDNFNSLVGGVAASWAISDDGKTYRFTIRRGMKFVSGNPVTARDAAFSLQRVVILNRSPAFILRQFGLDADNVRDRIRALDDDTLVIETEEAYAPSFLLNCLTAGVGSVVDRKVALDHAVNGDRGHSWLRTHSAGSGPFKLRRWKAHESLSLDRHEAHWRGAPEIKRVIIRHIGEAATQRLLLEKGDIDIARDLGSDQIDGLAANPDIVVRQAPKGGIYYLGLNQSNPYLRRPAVRQALKYLVDYEGLRSTILAWRAVVHQSFLPSGFLGAVEDKPYTLDVPKARSLLAEADLPEGFAVTMDTRNTSPVMEIAQALQATFAQADITLEIIPGDGKQVLTKYRARNHDIYIGRWGADYQDPHSNADAFARNPDNAADAVVKSLAWRNAWEKPVLTRMVDTAVRERDRERRVTLYQQLQRRHQETSPFVIMFQDIEIVAERANVHGFVSGPTFDTVFYRNVSKD